MPCNNCNKRAAVPEAIEGRAQNIQKNDCEELTPFARETHDPRFGNNPPWCGLMNELLPSASLIPLATAFVRPQGYGKIYNPEDCLRNGTCFPELSQRYGGPRYV